MWTLVPEIWLLIVKGLGFAVAVLHLAFVPVVLARRREPSVTFSWLLMLLLLPAVGVILYWVFGRGEVRRSARARRALLAARQRGQQAPDYAALPVAWRPLARTAWESGRAALSLGNRVSILQNAEQTYPAKLEAIRGAQRTIDLAYYVFRSDDTGRTFREALVEAASRGVAVRVLLDAFGTPTFGSFWVPLRRVGGRVTRFLPFNPLAGWSLNLRNHRKILVVDGQVGFTGGLNIGDEYFGTRRLGAWRDTHVRLEGPAVAQLAGVFADDWAFATGELPGPLPAASPFRDGTAVQILPSGPDDRAEAIYRVTFAAISLAQASLDLTTPYYIPDRALAEALITSALRGVRVRLLLPSRNNQPLTALASRSYWEELLNAGVAIHLYRPGMIHAKCIVVDGQWGSVGTANLDIRSFRLNFEVNALLYGVPEVEALAAAFEADLLQAVPVQAEAFQRRSLWAKAGEGGARLLSPIL